MNKQKFLAELGRLLTFMYEDDRARALDLYGEIFDEVGNDNAVLQLLVSPTRQAVNLARAYDAKDRGAQSADVPAYLSVIEDIRSQAEGLLPAMPKADESQLSLFGEPEQPVQPAHTENVFESFGFEFPVDEEPAAEKDELPDELPDGLNLFPDEDSGVVPPAPAPAPAPALADPVEGSEEKTPEQELDDFANSVAAFLADFGEAEEEPSPEAAPVRSAPEETLPAQEPVEPVQAPQEAESIWAIPAKHDAPVRANVPEMKETVTNVWILVLLTVLAVPVGLVGVGLLLIPALLALGLAALSLWVGFQGLVIAFTSFSVFADILLVFGLSLSLAAIGLLFFWVFIWLIAGVIPSLIRSICQFVGKHSNKEVPV